MTKDILFLCQYFYPEYITSSLLPYQTARELVDNGMKVDVICGYPKEYHSGVGTAVPKIETVDGILIQRVSYFQLDRTNSLFRLLNYFSFIASCFLKLFQLRHYKLIYVYSNPPLLPILTVLANVLFKTRFVFVTYDIYPDIAIKTGVLSESSPISWLTDCINAQVFKRATKIIALSKEMKHYLIETKQVADHKVQVIPNWATEEESIVVSPHKKSDKITISYLGNMGIPQDFDKIEAIISDKRVQAMPIQFIFAGHGSRKDSLREFVSSNHLQNVTVYDYLKGEDYQSVLANSDYHLLSLKAELNGLAVPSKFYSYIHNGKPIIALVHEDCDIAENIEQLDLGYVIPKGDLEGAISVFQKMISQNTEHKVQQNKELFTKEVQLKKYVDLSLEILKGEENV